MSDSVTPWTVAHQVPLSPTFSWNLLKFMSIELVMPSISFSAAPFSSCLQSLPGSGSFPMNWPSTSGDQSIGASASASVLLMNIQSWFPLGLTGFISFAVQRTLKHLFQPHNLKASILCCSAFFYGPTLTSVHDCWKNHSFDYTELCQQSDVYAFQYAF